jgi:hypothetical protein
VEKGKAYAGPCVENWNYGYVYLGTVTADSARYVTDYIQKKYNGKLGREKYGKRKPPFQTQSQGLGKAYALRNADKLLEDPTVRFRGKELSAPKYYHRILEIPTEVRAAYADERNKKLIQVLESKGIKKIAGSYWFHIQKAKRQHNRNLTSKQELFKKSKL